MSHSAASMTSRLLLSVRCLHVVSLTLFFLKTFTSRREKFLRLRTIQQSFQPYNEVLNSSKKQFSSTSKYIKHCLRKCSKWHSKRPKEEGRDRLKAYINMTRISVLETFNIEFPPPQSINKHKRDRVQRNDCSQSWNEALTGLFDDDVRKD